MSRQDSTPQNQVSNLTQGASYENPSHTHRVRWVSYSRSSQPRRSLPEGSHQPSTHQNQVPKSREGAGYEYHHQHDGAGAGYEYYHEHDEAGTGYEYHYQYDGARRATSSHSSRVQIQQNSSSSSANSNSVIQESYYHSSQGNQSLQEFGARRQVQIQQNSTSISANSNSVIQESYYQGPVHVKQYQSLPQAPERVRGRKHFSHLHPLHAYELEKEAKVTCEVCELELLGSAYGCTDCGFFMHNSCFDLPLKIQHESHSQHSLSLVPSSAYKKIGHDSFNCDACRNIGEGFVYHCSICSYDLHVSCAGLPQVVYRKDHKHPLNICYELPQQEKGVNCDVCDTNVARNGWVYYNGDSHYITHLHCAFEDEKFTGDELEDEEDDREDAILGIQNRLLSLQTK